MTTCQGHAKSTGLQCKVKSLPGSKYCIFHIEHAPLLLSGIVGALLGLGATEIYHSYVPTQEVREMQQIRTILTPIAAQQYPNVSMTDSLKRLAIAIPEIIDAKDILLRQVSEYKEMKQSQDETISKLTREMSFAKQGRVTTWNFKGSRLESRPGYTSIVTNTPEAEAFKNFVRYQDSDDWGRLIEAATQEIRKNPDWMTPYLLLGVAYGNIGQREKGIINLEKVIEMRPDDPQYAQAKELLKKLKENK